MHTFLTGGIDAAVFCAIRDGAQTAAEIGAALERGPASTLLQQLGGTTLQVVRASLRRLADSKRVEYDRSTRAWDVTSRFAYATPRQQWPRGPWDREPDEVGEWRDDRTGYPCGAFRNYFGAWCGRVGVPVGHVLHGLDSETVMVVHRIQPHGGVTWAQPRFSTLPRFSELRQPQPAPTGPWWFGFNCSHVEIGDYAPAYKTPASGAYVTLDKVMGIITALAQRFAEVEQRNQ